MQQVRLMLPGARCNLHCTYCLNSGCIKGGKSEVDFVKIFERIDKAHCDLISIWGGEPLCNSELGNILRTLREKYPRKQISLLTNGVLLNDDFIALFNNLGVHVGVSHDGPAQHLRGRDFLTPAYLEKLGKLKYFTGFNCVVTRENCDLNKVYDWFRKKCSRLKSNWQLTFEIFELTQQEILDFMPSVEQYNDLRYAYLTIAHHGRPHLESMRQRLNSNSPTGWSCGAEQRLTIDCTGNIYHCQVMAERNDESRPQAGLPLMCAACRYVNECRGICPVMSDNLRKKLCLCHYLYYDVKRELQIRRENERRRQRC